MQGVFYVIVKKINLIGVSLLLLVIASLFIFAKVPLAENKGDNDSAQEQLEVSPNELDEFHENLNKEGGFYHQVTEKLSEMGYEHQILGMTYSKDEIWIKFVLTNKEVNELEKVVVKEVFEELAIKNKLDPKIFKIKVSNDDGPDW